LFFAAAMAGRKSSGARGRPRILTANRFLSFVACSPFGPRNRPLRNPRDGLFADVLTAAWDFSVDIPSGGWLISVRSASTVEPSTRRPAP
jgi:hypothetical protein